ncbi:LAMI_0E09384g1_1 [Lachancea mirantina]|uniref:NADPH-dependent diflavin oxidoreductase 1 n=1 Tax=Lachancea mirantina TaxID=1230905 RepID=A0A1G4JNM2_9SACH|nr:LAMI_0E09384g1_1 [Lachancea mirantina]
MAIGTKIAILYGSETGNSHEFASILSYKLHKLHFPHALMTLGDYDAKSILTCKYLFIICSTTGQGELPRNAKEAANGSEVDTLWALLKRKNLPGDLLSHLKVGMLGLGDSSYPKFNYAVRKLHNRMVDQLGAQLLFARLEADESGARGSNARNGVGVEGVYFQFEKRVLETLMTKYPTRKVGKDQFLREPVSDENYLKPLFNVTLDESGPTCDIIEFSGTTVAKTGTVTNNGRITHRDHFQDVRRFCFQNQGEQYYPGDTASIYPCNSDESVQKFLECQPEWLSIADKPLKFEGILPSDLVDGGIITYKTLRTLLKYHLDINSIPRKIFFMKTWMFATDASRLQGGEQQLDQQRSKLRQFALDEDMEDLYDYCNRPRRSILEVLQDFPSLVLPWTFLFDFLPILKPRLFSISSSPSQSPVELTIALVKYQTILRQVRRGVCSQYIDQLREGDIVRYKLQHNQLLKKDMKQKPCIMIGPGVGIAPMMCLLRSHFFEDQYLFFGNRFNARDFLYKEELSAFEQEGLHLYTCFSRDPVNNFNVKYVQDLLWQNGQVVGELLIEKKGIIYLCGSSGKMPVQVRITILEILKRWCQMNDEQAQTYLQEMERTDRYLQETW